FPDDVISEFDSAFDNVRCRVFQRHVYLTRFFEHAEAARRCIEKCDERLRKNVLSRVLLHVIETAGPINSSFNCSPDFWGTSLNHVQYAVVFIVNALDDPRCADCAGVARLAAPSGIESSAVERDGCPTANALTLIHDASFKLDQMRVFVIKAFGYGHSSGCLVWVFVVELIIEATGTCKHGHRSKVDDPLNLTNQHY